MKISKIVEIIWSVVWAMFVIKGILSDFGYVEKFDSTQIYQFAWLGFAMGWYAMFNIFIETIRKSEEE